jgi:hypothetical protein
MAPLLRVVLGLAAFVLLGEGAVRVAGLADSPLYDATPEVGYVARPNQSGQFLRNHWAINDRGMIDPRKFDPASRPVLVLGDSIIFGGNPFDQSERVASLLQAMRPGQAVYPVAAGGWSLANVLAYLRVNPDVAASASRFLFVVNEDDFGPASAWKCETYNPTKRPLSHLWWATRKYVLPPDCEVETPPQLVPRPRDLARDLDAFMATYGERVRFVLYPKRDALDRDFSARLLGLSARIAPAQVLNLARAGGWSTEMYKDHLHPNHPGNAALARVLSSLLPPSQPAP